MSYHVRTEYLCTGDLLWQLEAYGCGVSSHIMQLSHRMGLLFRCDLSAKWLDIVSLQIPTASLVHFRLEMPHFYSNHLEMHELGT